MFAAAHQPACRAQESEQNQPPTRSLTKGESSCFGKKIGKLELPHASEPDSQMLLKLSGLHEGDTLERASLQQALRSLFATGRYTDLRAECEVSPDGTASVTFSNTLHFFIGHVTVENAPSPPRESQIVNTSKLQLGEAFTSEKLDLAIQNIQRLLQQNGYYKSSLTYSEREDPQTQQVAISFHVQPGSRAHVGEVRVNRGALYTAEQIGDIGHLHSGDDVTAQTVSNAIRRIRKRYQKKNRWLAQVEVAPTFQPPTNSVDYTFHIDAGPIVSIEVNGFRLSRSLIRKNIPVYEEDALDDDLLNEGRRNLLTYMESRGYFEAKVTLRKETEPNAVRVIYEIDSGERHRVVRVAITGNKYFRDEDLRPSMQVQAKSILLPRGRYSDALLRSDVRDIENKYRANGFSATKIDTTNSRGHISDHRQPHGESRLPPAVEHSARATVFRFQRGAGPRHPAELLLQPGIPEC